MYNEQQKSRYLKFLEKNESGSVNMYESWLFVKTENFEIKLNKDVYDFTFEEIIYMYKMLNFRNINTLSTINVMLNQYTKWAISEGLVKINQNVPGLMTRYNLEECINKALLQLKILSRNDILDIVNELQNPRDQFMILGVFEFGRGPNFCDIALTGLDSIDYKDQTMKLYSGRIVKVSDKLINYAYSASEADKYFKEVNGCLRHYTLYDNGTIIKSISDTNDTERFSTNAYRSVAYNLRDVNQNLSIKNIIESGKIQFIKDDMERLCIDNLEEYFSSPKSADRTERIARIENQFMCSKIIVKRFIKTYGDCF